MLLMRWGGANVRWLEGIGLNRKLGNDASWLHAARHGHMAEKMTSVAIKISATSFGPSSAQRLQRGHCQCQAQKLCKV